MSLFSSHSASKKPGTPRGKRAVSPIEGQRNFSVRPSSAKLISRCLYKIIGDTPKCHGNIMRKIDNLEKKQEMWRERAQVWDREKRNYQMTLECVFFK